MLSLNSFILPLLLYLTAFLIGFLFGRTMSPKYVSTMVSSNDTSIDTKGSFFKPEKREKSEKKVVKIDDSTFVTNVSSESLEKKGSTLGTETTVEDDVGSSASKLAQLKKNR
jgi:hypothetical protein